MYSYQFICASAAWIDAALNCANYIYIYIYSYFISVAAKKLDKIQNCIFKS